MQPGPGVDVKDNKADVTAKVRADVAAEALTFGRNTTTTDRSRHGDIHVGGDAHAPVGSDISKTKVTVCSIL